MKSSLKNKSTLIKPTTEQSCPTLDPTTDRDRTRTLSTTNADQQPSSNQMQNTSNVQHTSNVVCMTRFVTFNDTTRIYYFEDCEDRKSYWVSNRCHFQRQCSRIQDSISFVFEDSHRNKIQDIIRNWNSDPPSIISSVTLRTAYD